MGGISTTMHLIPLELSETDLVPFYASPPPGERVLVLAPHPDDETLGCGGSLRILSNGGRAVRVLFLTKGEKAVDGMEHRERYAAAREREARKALEILGIPEYAFLGFPDRELLARFSELREQVVAHVDAFRPDCVYSPSPVELNPDHRAAAALAGELKKTRGMAIAFYELVTPIRPNILIDVSAVYTHKEEAMKAYESQLEITDYLYLIRSLNAYRTMTLGKGTRYAEAFWILRDEEHPELWLSYQNKLSER